MAGRTIATIVPTRERTPPSRPATGDPLISALRRALLVVTIGALAPLSTIVAQGRSFAAAAAVLIVGASWETSLLVARGRPRHLAAALVVPAAAFLAVGPALGRSGVLVLCSTIFLLHLAVLGWVAMVAWPRPAVVLIAGVSAGVTIATASTTPVAAAILVPLAFALADRAQRAHAQRESAVVQLSVAADGHTLTAVVLDQTLQSEAPIGDSWAVVELEEPMVMVANEPGAESESAENGGAAGTEAGDADPAGPGAESGPRTQGVVAVFVPDGSAPVAAEWWLWDGARLKTQVRIDPALGEATLRRVAGGGSQTLEEAP